jgi:hypothetical protein
MSASDVVRALRKYIKEVEKNGMYIGRYKDKLVIERIDGTLDEVWPGARWPHIGVRKVASQAHSGPLELKKETSKS